MHKVTIEDLKKLDTSQYQLIDIRSKEEYDEKHIPFASQYTIEDILANLHIINPEKLIITVCTKGGGRSAQAANELRKLGYNSAYLIDGTNGWHAKS